VGGPPGARCVEAATCRRWEPAYPAQPVPGTFLPSVLKLRQSTLAGAATNRTGPAQGLLPGSSAIQGGSRRGATPPEHSFQGGIQRLPRVLQGEGYPETTTYMTKSGLGRLGRCRREGALLGGLLANTTPLRRRLPPLQADRRWPALDPDGPTPGGQAGRRSSC
jgi:hypothetical protein